MHAGMAGVVERDGRQQIHRTEHFVPVGANRWLHVTETFSVASFRRPGPPRAIVMLPGPLTDSKFLNIDVPGYDGGAIMARTGFFAYTVDFEGTGQSSYPVQGTSVTLASQVEAVKRVVAYVRALRGVPRVDLLGESWGGGVAAEVCADHRAVRSCILASMLYKNPSALAASQFQSPSWIGFLQSLPWSYLTTTTDIYELLVDRSTPAVQAWTRATSPGIYAVRPLFDAVTLPFFDPTVARVPGLILRGGDDPRTLPSDARELAAHYGEHGAELVTIAGGGHVPRVEPGPHAEYWNAVTAFVDRTGDDSASSDRVSEQGDGS